MFAVVALLIVYVFKLSVKSFFLASLAVLRFLLAIRSWKENMAAAILLRISNKQRSTDTVCKTISALQLLVDKFLRLLIVLVYRILSKFVFQLSNSFQEIWMFRKQKYRYVGITVIIAFIIILFVIELVISKPIFNITRFSLNYAVSFPFILLSLVLNCGIAAIMNKPIFRKQNVFMRIIIEGILAVLVAAILVVVCNLPYMPDVARYVRTILFLKSVAAATLINIFILAAVEFLIQVIISRNLQNENAMLRYRQLKSQINPHFLFNSLNVLVSLINKNQETAVRYTKRLSTVYRYVLTQDVQDTVTVKEETEFIENYISILKIRFDKGLEFKFDIESDDMLKFIPPMSLQLLIENAVKHNAVLPHDPLVIRIFSDGSDLYLSNNLIPRISCSEGTGIGLKNLSKKYAILAETDIAILRNKDTFTVKLPLLRKYSDLIYT